VCYATLAAVDALQEAGKRCAERALAAMLPSNATNAR
jgi:hypothetical protein